MPPMGHCCCDIPPREAIENFHLPISFCPPGGNRIDVVSVIFGLDPPMGRFFALRLNSNGLTATAGVAEIVAAQSTYFLPESEVGDRGHKANAEHSGGRRCGNRIRAFLPVVGFVLVYNQDEITAIR